MLTGQFILPIAHDLVIDLFAGGGGASTGIEQAIGRHVDIAINHDPEAVALHQANHPQTRHFTSHLVKLRGDNTGSSTADPLHTVSAQGLHHGEVRAFLVKYYGTDQDPALREPLHTVTTKDRFGLVTVQGEQYQIADIGLRMLTPRELYRAQGFPDSYIIDNGADGRALSKTAQVRMCGNSVCPPLSRAIVGANYRAMHAIRQAA